MSTRRTTSLVVTGVAIATIAFVKVTAAVAQQIAADPSRQADVERKAVKVMPFDQQRAMHMFRPTLRGGVQTVLSQDGDSTQVKAIRSHLRREADRFARGDYSDPTAIHGSQMPGLPILMTAGRNMSVAYQELPTGAQITFATRDPITLKALHDWFAAQVSDHGSHAMMMK